MPAQIISSVENNFTKGLITESTGLNFPENAATDCDNVTFTLIGDVTRRFGIDYEDYSRQTTIDRTDNAIATYKWNNVGGDGSTQLIVTQVGSSLYFYRSSSATTISPISAQLLATSITISSFVASGGSYDVAGECEFAEGNGYLFVFHPSCDPFYLTYNAGSISANRITVKIRDFTGIPDNLGASDRPSTLSDEHKYNLINQGWTSGTGWAATSTSPITVGTGAKTFTIATGITGITVGDVVKITNTTAASPGGRYQPAGTWVMSATVSSYTSGTGALAVNVVGVHPDWVGSAWADWTLTPISTGKISTWFAAINNYPSNADVWWYFKNASDVFDPATTIANVTLSTAIAPQGHVIVEAFNQQRALLSGVSNITPVVTTVRPGTGTWFQGRVWYTNVNAQQAATGDAPFYNWSENIYFSQVNIGTDTNFGLCYQENDPTSDRLNGLLPTDGGVLQIQGCGAIYKLFPVVNGMLVFAANGIWFITGSQGIGFTANDYTVTKLSNVETLSRHSFVNVLGLPYFWNEEGIYQVVPTQGGALNIESITVGTIQSFYDEIPKQSKKYARGVYHPINYVVQWAYKSTDETSVTDRYTFNKLLNLNTHNKCFYPYSIDTETASINSIIYVAGPGGSNSPPPAIKYFVSSPYAGSYYVSFGDEKDTAYVDWNAVNVTGVNYTSYFVTGYKLHGKGQMRFQIPYIYIFSRNEEPTQYFIQGLWDYAAVSNSNRWSTREKAVLFNPNFGMGFKRHRIRGRGLTLQLKVTSVDGEPFDIMGWSTYEQLNSGV